MPLRQHEAVVVGILRVLRIETHLAKEERRDDLGRGHAGRRVTGTRFGGRRDGVNPELGGNIAEGGS
jgi:hypothetical protein